MEGLDYIKKEIFVFRPDEHDSIYGRFGLYYEKMVEFFTPLKREITVIKLS